MQTKWEVSEAADQALIHAITSKLNLPDVIAQILVNRGVLTPEAANVFFNGKTEDLY